MKTRQQAKLLSRPQSGAVLRCEVIRLMSSVQSLSELYIANQLIDLASLDTTSDCNMIELVLALKRVQLLLRRGKSGTL